MKRIQYFFVVGALFVGMGMLTFSLPVRADPASGAQPPPCGWNAVCHIAKLFVQRSFGDAIVLAGDGGIRFGDGTYQNTAAGGGSGVSGWDGGPGMIAFGQGNALTGTPGLTWDGGVGQLIFRGPFDGGIVFQENSNGTIFFNGMNSNDGEYMLYSSNLTGGLLVRTNNFDIGHKNGSGAGTFTCDGKADIAAAKATYAEFDSDNNNYFHMSAMGNLTNEGLVISPKGNGRVMIGSLNDNGIDTLQVDGGVSANAPKDKAAFTLNTIGSRICLDPGCQNIIVADGGANLNGGDNAGGITFKSVTTDTSAHVNSAFVFDAYKVDNASPIANANLVEFRNAGALEFAVSGGGAVTFSGVTITAGVVFANELVDNNANTLWVAGNANDGASAIGIKFGNEAGGMSTAGSQLAVFCNGAVNACTSKVVKIDGTGYIASATPVYYPTFPGTSITTNGQTLGEQVLPAHAMTMTAAQWRVSSAGVGGTTGFVVKGSDGTNTCTVTTACTVTGNQRTASVNGTGVGCAFPASASITYTVDATSDCATYPILLGLLNVEEKWQ